jgi:hypothetical protein
MSKMGRPLVHAVLPLIDNLTDKLQAASEDSNLSIAVRAGALAGIKVLNKYYSKTDDSVIYRVSMGELALFCIAVYTKKF